MTEAVNVFYDNGLRLERVIGEENKVEQKDFWVSYNSAILLDNQAMSHSVLFCF